VFKLDKGRAKYDLRKYYFTNRVVNAWNSLPDHVVLSDTTSIQLSLLHGLGWAGVKCVGVSNTLVKCV